MNLAKQIQQFLFEEKLREEVGDLSDNDADLEYSEEELSPPIELSAEYRKKIIRELKLIENGI